MSTELPSQADQNKAVVQRFYDMLGTGSEEDGLSPDALEIIIDTFRNERSIELCLGEPFGGVFEGPEEIAVGRHRLHELAGYGQPDHNTFRYFADGDTRVVVEAVNHGIDLSGQPWSMTVVELVDVIDGKIVHKSTFFQDPNLMRSIMLERHASNPEYEAPDYWQTHNPLAAMQADDGGGT